MIVRIQYLSQFFAPTSPTPPQPGSTKPQPAIPQPSSSWPIPSQPRPPVPLSVPTPAHPNTPANPTSSSPTHTAATPARPPRSCTTTGRTALHSNHAALHLFQLSHLSARHTICRAAKSNQQQPRHHCRAAIDVNIGDNYGFVHNSGVYAEPREHVDVRAEA